MTVARMAATLPVTLVRRTMGRVERVLRPVDDADVAADTLPDAATPLEDVRAVADDDSSVTRELLRATTTDEPPAARASRQARLYLERRRQQLNEALRDDV